MASLCIRSMTKNSFQHLKLIAFVPVYLHHHAALATESRALHSFHFSLLAEGHSDEG